MKRCELWSVYISLWRQKDVEYPALEDISKGATVFSSWISNESSYLVAVMRAFIMLIWRFRIIIIISVSRSMQK